MKRVIPFFIAIVLAASSCGDKSKQIGNATAENCLLALVDTSVVVKWTAYKTTEKIGGSGTFDIVSVGGYTKAETAADVLKNASFEIPVTSINSGVADRDGKIFGYFFSNMVNTSLLAGQVLEAGQEQWKVGLVMNDVRDTLIFNFI
jgi:polyisoprenoid-binding protein YceI